MSFYKRDKVLAKVPTTMHINGINTGEALKQATNNILADQVKINDLNARISAEIEFKLNSKDAAGFIDSFLNWEKKPADARIFHYCQPFIHAIETEHEQLSQRVDKQLNNTIDLKNVINTNQNTINTKCDNLLRSNNKRVSKKIIEEIERVLSTTFDVNDLYILALESLLYELRKFNDQRIVWMQFLIGQRKYYKDSIPQIPMPMEHPRESNPWKF